MRIKLSGGRLDGTEMKVSDSLTVLSCPLLSRHSWDDDALNISYLDYYRTEMEVEDGTVIFVPQEVAHHYV